MIIIPARVKSTRFENKVLHKINGIPMVIKTAIKAKEVDKVVIATDSNEVIEVAKKYNFDAILTSSLHKSGTDRIYEAAKRLNLSDDEIILNVQADEPFIEKEVIQKLQNLTKKKVSSEKCLIASCYKKINEELASDENFVKVVLNFQSEAIYFSRSKVPFARDEKGEFFGHLGLYGFTLKSLEIFCNLQNAPIEDQEKLEQLRALYFGYKIAMCEVSSQSFGIDTKKDLEKALKIFC